MGKFDGEIAWCRERCAIAREDIEDFVKGQRQFSNDLDVTDKLLARAKSDVEQLSKLIKAYESINV